MSVYILGINGSPRPYGNTIKALLMSLRGAEMEGAKTRTINIYELDIKECLGCVSDSIKACSYPCPIDDDMRFIYEEILRCDGIIIATPIYWYGVSGPLKNFIDRLTVFENMIFITGRSWIEGKVAGFIAIGNDTGAIAVIQNLMVVMNSMGLVIPPWSLAYYTGNGDVTNVENVVLDCVNLGRVVTLMAKILKGEIKGSDVKIWYRADEEFKYKALEIAKEVQEVINRQLQSQQY